MRSASKPKDKFTPFYALKSCKLPVPDPATCAEKVIGIPAIFTEREIFFKKGKPATLLRFRAECVVFRKMVDEEGSAVWAYPMELPKQIARLN